MPRLPLLALLAVLAGSFAFHAYRAEHPTTSYQSADERSYGKLAVAIAEHHSYGADMKDPLHWPPGAPLAFAAAHRLFGSAQSAKSYDIPAAYWVQALASLGTALAASPNSRCAAAKASGAPGGQCSGSRMSAP